MTQMKKYRDNLPLNTLTQIDIVGKNNQKMNKVLDALNDCLEDIHTRITQYEAVKGACCDSSKT